MYGVSEQLMQRMEKRMKEKIYREMIQEQQKYKKKYRERHKDADIAPERFKTEPNQHHQEYQFNKYEDKPRPSPFFHEESTFLPVINKRYSPSENQTSDSRVNPEYRKYISRRNQRLKEQEHPQRKRTSASAVFQPERSKAGKEESEEEAEQYLNECEQIINNLRMLNKRNQDKLKERQSRKEQEQKSSPKNKSFSANVFAETPEYRLNSFNAKRRDHHLKNTSLTDPYRNQQPESNSFRVNSPFRIESPQNQFSEFSDLETRPRERANALTISVNSKPNSVGMRGKEVNMREKAESQPKAKENFKRLSPIKKEEEEEQQNQEQEEQPEEEDKTAEVDKRSLAKDENKRQKAIVKYLKKARLRGNLLYQKIQSKKTQPKKSQQPNPNPQNPPSNDPNSSQQPDPNSNPQGQPPNLDSSPSSLPARQ